MSGWEGRCPTCGAGIVFALGTSLLRICEHCGSAVARKGVDLESYGKVASLLPTSSVLQLGVRGEREGMGAFTLVGRIQLDHGRGVWDEWLLALGQGKWAWLAEAQGRFYLMRPVEPLPPLPRFSTLKPDRAVDVGPAGVFRVVEANAGKFVSGQGELPFAIEPGSTLHYVDLAGKRGALATIDYGSGEEAESLYVGEEVQLADLKPRGLPAEAERRVQAQARSLKCPSCGGPLELRCPDATRRVGCPYCGSLLDATNQLAVLETLKEAVKPAIPLGSKGRLDGVEWTVIGYLERSCTVEGEVYGWCEYLLHEPKRGFRWLVESSDHWSFVGPASAGDIEDSPAGDQEIRYQGHRFRHFQTAPAKVERVLGEFYWEVAAGQSVGATDYICPPAILSLESEASESSWSRGVYKEPAEIWRAFRLKGEPPRPQGVAPNQPNPFDPRLRSLAPRAALLCALAVVLLVLASIAGRKALLDQHVSLAPELTPGQPETVALSEPFTISRRGNVRVEVSAPLEQSWLYLAGALINDQTGEVHEFDADLSYYSGPDWKEGSRRVRRYVGSVAPGKYILRLDPQWEAGKAPGFYDVKLTGAVPRLPQLFLALALLLAWPMVLFLRRTRFEKRRWDESDHPWGAESGSDTWEDDE